MENGEGEAAFVTSILGFVVAGTVAVLVGDVTVVDWNNALAEASLITSPASRSACVTA